MDVFKIDQSMGGLGSGSRVTESSRHHQVTTEVSFDTTSDFNLSFFDSSSTPPTPPPNGGVSTGVGASSSSSSTSSSGVVLKEEYDEPSPPPQQQQDGGVFDALSGGGDGCGMFNSPPPTTPPSPGGLDSASNPLSGVGVGGDSGVKIKSEFDVTNSFNGGQQQQHRALVAPPRSSLSLFPPPKAGNNNPPPTPPSTPITLKNGKEKNTNPVPSHSANTELRVNLQIDTIKQTNAPRLTGRLIGQKRKKLCTLFVRVRLWFFFLRSKFWPFWRLSMRTAALDGRERDGWFVSGVQSAGHVFPVSRKDRSSSSKRRRESSTTSRKQQQTSASPSFLNFPLPRRAAQKQSNSV